jgi:hypothetical protein
MTGLSSCLKDKSLTLPDADGAIKNVIEFQNVDFINSGTSSIYPVYVKSFEILPSGTLNLVVNYAGVDAAPENINVKLALDLTIITKYNAKLIADARAAAVILGEDPDDAEADVQGDLYEPLDPALYSLGSLDVTIPAGQRTANFAVTVKPNLFDFNKRTALAFKIVSASTGVISGNFSNVIVKIEGKNKYDGSYKFTGSATGAPERTNVYQAGTFTWPGNVQLRTASANVIDLYDDTYNWGGGISQWILMLGASPTTGAGFGSTRPRFTLDLATNKVTSVVNAFPNPPNGRAFAIDPSYDSKYDPATKKLTVRFFFTQPNFNPLTVTYNFTYDKSR